MLGEHERESYFFEGEKDEEVVIRTRLLEVEETVEVQPDTFLFFLGALIPQL